MQSLYDSHEDFILKEIVPTHLPDYHKIDLAPFLRAAENIIHLIVLPNDTNTTNTAAWNGVKFDLKDAEIGRTIHQLAAEMLLISSRGRSAHSMTTAVLEIVGKYSWGSKVAIVLAALAMSCGKFWLIMQFCPTNHLALSISIMKSLTYTSEVISEVKRWFRALRSLFEKMIDVTKCILEFENLPVQYLSLDYDALASTKTCVHIASYWVIRKAVSCMSQIDGILAMKEVCINSLTARCEVWSSVHKISNVNNRMHSELDAFNLHIECKLQISLSHLFKEAYADNQTVLSTLFAMKDNFPLRLGPSNEKIAVAALANKDVILFISEPIVDLEKVLLILQQLECDMEKPFEVVWVPIGRSNTWSIEERKAFAKLAQILPWYSLCEPSALCLPAINFIKDVWHFQDDPLMVVLDSRGNIVSLDAMDMILVWGTKAYPFSTSRESELWAEQTSVMELFADEIDPLLTYWVHDGGIICLYGTSNTEWARELSSMMSNIIASGIPLVLIYVGSMCIESSKEVLAAVIREKRSGYLSITKIKFFWMRLESIRRLKVHIGSHNGNDYVLSEANLLLALDSGNEDWLLVAEQASTIIFRGNEVLECLSFFGKWGENFPKLGFIGAIKIALDPLTGSKQCCNSSTLLPYVEGMSERVVLCETCNLPMKKHMLYQCTNVNSAC